MNCQLYIGAAVFTSFSDSRAATFLLKLERMPFPIEEKLVIAIASSALFDLTEPDAVFCKCGEDAYRKYQRERLEFPLPPAVAFPFIRRLLKLNDLYGKDEPVEVVFLSKNDPDSGRRIYRSAKYYGLRITRGAFLTKKSPHPYIPAFSASLFLSANRPDVVAAIEEGYPAGVVLPSTASDDTTVSELKVAFDFDGVLADDEAEAIYQKTANVERFHRAEHKKRNQPHNPGPLKGLLSKISRIQKLESTTGKRTKGYNPALRIAIITARSAPANERVVTTLNDWGISIDEIFFLGGIEKKHVLSVLRPHIFFDDQLKHLEGTADAIPSVHIPFGIANRSMNSKK